MKPSVGSLAARLRRGAAALMTPRIALLTLIVGGAALRVFRLAELGDFDFDEVASIWYARSDPGDIFSTIAGAPFEHPPFYYVALHYWISWFGEAEPIARAFSIPFGVLLIPATHRLARCYVREWPAVFAAGVVTASPLLVFYSRETRMYAPAALFGVLALVFFEQAMRGGRRRHWVGLAATLVIGAYVDFTIALAAVAMTVVLLFRYRVSPRRVTGFLILELVAIALVVPWLLVASGLRDSLPALGTGDLTPGVLGAVASSAGLDLFVGIEDVRGGRSALVVAIFTGALVVAGIAISAVRRRHGLLIAYLGASVGFLALLLVFDKQYQARYVLPAVPAAAILAAIALASVRGKRLAMLVGAVATVAAIAGPVFASRTYFTDYVRADYRSITTTIEALARPIRPGRDAGKFRDAVVLSGPWQGWYWRHYFPDFLDKVDVWFLPDEVPPAVTSAEVEAKLARASDNHRRLWVVLAGLEQADPDRRVQSWLDTHLWRARSEVYRNGVLHLYLTNLIDLVDRRGPVHIAGDFYTEKIHFGGYREDQGPSEAGDGIRFNIFLQSTRDISYDLRIRVSVVGPDGQVYANEEWARDPWTRRTSEWPPGETYLQRAAVWVPSEAMPGDYHAYVAFIDPEGAKIPMTGTMSKNVYEHERDAILGLVRIVEPSIPLPNEAELRAALSPPIG